MEPSIGGWNKMNVRELFSLQTTQYVSGAETFEGVPI